MSETVSYYLAEAEDQTNEADAFSNEAAFERSQAFPRLDGELMPLVVANADVVVLCQWMGGAEVTLAEAMLNYPRQMTEAMASEIIAEVYAMLANRVLEQEEPEEAEEQPSKDETLDNKEAKKPQEEPTKIEQGGSKQTQKSNAKKPSTKSKNNARLATTLSQTAKPAEQSQPKAIEVAGKTTPLSIDKAEAATLKAETADKIGRTDNISKVSAETSRSVNPVSTEAVAATIGVSEISPQSSVASEARTSLTYDEGSITSQPELAAPDLETSQTGAIDLSGVVEIEDELGFSEIEVSQELIDLTIGEESSVGLAEPEEILINHHSEVIAQASEPLIINREEATVTQLSYEPEPQEKLENDFPEKLVPIVLEVEEIENSLIKIGEQIEAAEPETAEVAGVILDKISELTAKIEQQTESEPINESEAQEELEELFTRLLEQLGIEHTPDLVQSLTRFILRRHSIEKIENRGTKEPDTTPQGQGTHEIIKKLLAFVRNIKKTIGNATAIGKSALWLYTYDFPAELRKHLAA